MRRAYFILLPFVLMLFGCVTDDPSQTVDLTPLSAQIGNLSDANADLKVVNERLQAANAALLAENEHLKAMLRADADAGLEANGKGWLPFERYVWNHQIALLPVTPDAETACEWDKASTLYETGGETAMQQIINGLNADAKTTNAKLGELSQNIEQLTKERDAAQKAVTAAEAKVKQLEADLANAIEEGKRQMLAQIRAQQVAYANWGAVVCMSLAFLLSMAALWATGVRVKLLCMAGVSVGWSLSLAGLARWMGMLWFEITIGVVWVGIFIAFLVWLIRHGQLQAAAKKKAAEAGMVADKLVAAMDTYYDTKASDAAKADMDASLWPALANLGPAYNAAVKRIKAAQCDELSKTQTEK